MVKPVHKKWHNDRWEKKKEKQSKGGDVLRPTFLDSAPAMSSITVTPQAMTQ
jgi:hypothetical protein